MAYVALDLGYSSAATTNARAALLSAQTAGDARLAAWVRGTQSLIARFSGNFTQARDYAREGLSYQAGGTAPARLWSAEAQSLAHLGDHAGTRNALSQARRVLSHDDNHGEVGPFTFTAAKQAFYAGSSLIWLDDKEDAITAAAESTVPVATGAPSRSPSSRASRPVGRC